MFKILKKLNQLLDKKQKLQMAGLVVLMIIGAALQTLGVGMLVSAVNVIIDANALENSDIVRFLYDCLHAKTYTQFSVTVLAMLILTYVVKNVYLYIQMKLTYNYVYTNQFRTSELMMRNFMRRDYEFFLNADTAVVQRSITSDVNNMYALIQALLQLFSDAVISLFVVTYCFITNGQLTIILSIVMVILMIVIKWVLKPILHKAGKDNQDYYAGLFKHISQTVLGIKEVKVTCTEKNFVKEYEKCGKGYVDAVQKYTLYNNIPKLLIETACVATMMLYMIVMMLNGASETNLLEVITTLAAAAIVLLPCVNRVNNQINSIAYFEPFFMGVTDNLQYEISDELTDMAFAETEPEKMEISDKIELKDIVYSYPNTDKLIFDGANMQIPVGKSVGVVGTTGAGKSTIIDVLLGLLKLKSGSITADGMDIHDNYRGWLKNVGYIPQMIYMLDDTIKRNVAFGIPDDQIDEARVWEVLEQAQLDEFVRNLPEGLNTGIGERGVRISGGQRQRIGIARALYNDPEILVLDEATSALDNDTEAAVMDAINHFQGKKTLVIIAHRLGTIANCDLVYRVGEGKITLEKMAE